MKTISLAVLAMTAATASDTKPKTTTTPKKTTTTPKKNTTTTTTTTPADPAPQFPDAYTSLWIQYLSFTENNKPPYTQGAPPLPYEAYQGTTYYDWANKQQASFMDSAAWGGLGCHYGNGQCKMVSSETGGPNNTAVTYSWMMNGPDEGNCCIEDPSTMPLRAPDFASKLIKQPSVNINEEPVEWYSTNDTELTTFVGFYTDKFLNGPDGKPTYYQKPAMYGGHQGFDLAGWHWQTYATFDLSPPPADVFLLHDSCIYATKCKPQAYPYPSTTTAAPESIFTSVGFPAGAAMGAGVAFVLTALLFCCYTRQKKRKTASLNDALLGSP